MVFNLVGSSLHHALETLTFDEKNTLKEQLFSILGLNLKTNTKKY